jgi:NAD(P)H-flavin reductase
MVFRSEFYELVAKTHLFAAVLLVGVLWMHLSLTKSLTRTYLQIGLYVAAGTNVVALGGLLWRNYGRGMRVTAYTQEEDDLLLITLALPRPWTFRPGQYINLCIPGAGFWSFLQWHPYMIAWWTEADDKDPVRIKLLVRPRHGFTRTLHNHAAHAETTNAAHANNAETTNAAHANKAKTTRYRAWVEGPLGYAQDFSEYAHVLLIAEDIGVAAQLPVVKDLVERQLTSGVRTRKVTLAWQVERESKLILQSKRRLTCADHRNWIARQMNELLEKDKCYKVSVARSRCRSSLMECQMLDIQLYDKNGKGNGAHGYGEHERIKCFPHPMDFAEVFGSIIKLANGGRLLISGWWPLRSLAMLT